MAKSPMHKFGQIIGDLIEELPRKQLAMVAKKHRLYLDFRHERAARFGNKNVRWKDARGNSHDLDYVLEFGGSEDVQGEPKAFIESAWRRYTKHSKNKAQEIQGAVLELYSAYSHCEPFLGVVLGGVFTDSALKQLKSHGFSIIFCGYDKVVKAFRSVGIDAAFDEDTPDEEVYEKVKAYEKLIAAEHRKLLAKLARLVKDDLDAFVAELEESLNRTIERVLVLALHGNTLELHTVDDAIQAIEAHDKNCFSGAFARFEITIQYSNGDEIEAAFEKQSDAIKHLLKFR